MEIGIVRERGGGGCDKRAVLLPGEVGKLVDSGRTVYVETGTGQGLQIPDEEYRIIQNLNTITEIKDSLKDFTVPTQHKVKNQKKKKLIRMLQPLKKIVCIDMKAYGPFEAEDVVTLPEENANILIEKGLAVGVET